MNFTDATKACRKAGRAWLHGGCRRIWTLMELIVRLQTDFGADVASQSGFTLERGFMVDGHHHQKGSAGDVGIVRVGVTDLNGPNPDFTKATSW